MNFNKYIIFLLSSCFIAVAAPYRTAAVIAEGAEAAPQAKAEKQKRTDDFIELETMAKKGDAKAQARLGIDYFLIKDYPNAIYWLFKAADQGEPEAEGMLGAFYLRGVGVEQNLEKGAALLQKAAAKGVAEAQYNLGIAYHDGEGVPKDAALAFHWFEKAANAGYARAQTQLANCYYTGAGVIKDDEKAFSWYEKSAVQEDPNAMYNLGICFIDGIGVAKNVEKGIDWITRAADKGDVSAFYKLGECYKNGLGTPQDRSKSIYWYKKAAEKGDESAKNALAAYYGIGFGTGQFALQMLRKASVAGYPAAQTAFAYDLYYGSKLSDQNYREAFYWFLQAANQGDSDAAFQLGLMFLNGQGTPKDYQKTLHWFEKVSRNDKRDIDDWIKLVKKEMRQNKFEPSPKKQALFESYMAKKEEPAAQFKIAECYWNGDGIAPDGNEAVRWFELAAAQANMEAMTWLGYCYLVGISVEANPAKARACFEKAAFKGFAPGQYWLGFCCAAGAGGEPDAAMAAGWYEKAAMQNYAPAQYAFAVCCQLGWGRSANEALALEWYIKAAMGGNVGAMTNAAFCYEKGIGARANLQECYYWLRQASNHGSTDSANRLWQFEFRDAAGNKIDNDTLFRQMQAEKDGAAGNVEAMLLLALKYETGAAGTPKDPLKAAFWLRKAAEKDQPTAQYYLANYYAEGIGVEKNPQAALYWYEKAAQNGNINAMRELAKWYAEGRHIKPDKEKEEFWKMKANAQEDAR